MKITKYPQSCLVLEKSGQCIVIDPGNLVTAEYRLTDLCLVEAVLYTHQHGDHFDPALLGQLRDADVEIYCNADVAAKIEGPVKVVKNGDEFVVAGFSVEVHDLPHFPLPDGSDGPPNTGFVIDGALFHPGDGIKIQGLTAPNIALPIGGPTDDFFDTVIALADSVKAKKIIPVHFDGRYKPDPQEFIAKAGQDRVILLKNGESAEL